MGLRTLAACDCGFESLRERGCLSLVSVVCCQRSLSWSDHSSRGVLQSVVYPVIVIGKAWWWDHGRESSRSFTEKKNSCLYVVIEGRFLHLEVGEGTVENVCRHPRLMLTSFRTKYETWSVRHCEWQQARECQCAEESIAVDWQAVSCHMSCVVFGVLQLASSSRQNLPYILESNPHLNLIRTSFCRFLKRKKNSSRF